MNAQIDRKGMFTITLGHRPGLVRPVELLEGRLLFHGAIEGGQVVQVQPRALALIDSTLPDEQVLLASLPAGTQTCFFNSQAESAHQVLRQASHAALQDSGQFDSILLFSHGTSGGFEIGRDLVSLRTLSRTRSAWKKLGAELAPGASIDLFGCDVASDVSGRMLLQRLSRISGADVYGSTNTTGRDGDWTLEAHAGAGVVSSVAPLNASVIHNYSANLGVVAIVTALANPTVVTASTASLSVTATDVPLGESHLAYTWSTSVAPAGANPTFSVNGTNAAKNTTVSFDRAGAYTFNVTASDGSGSASSTVLVTVSQTLTSLAVAPATASLNLNQARTFVATGYDQFGQAMLVQPVVAWSEDSGGVGAVDALGVYSSATAGPATVRATAGSLSAIAAVTVRNSAPTVAAAASASPSTVTGNYAALSVLGADDGGEGNLTYTWAVTSAPAGAAPVFSLNGSNAAKNTVVTFDRAGTYVFTATISDGTLSTTSLVTVSVTTPLSSIAVTPSNTTVNENGTLQFSAVGFDQFGHTLASQPTFTWTRSVLGVGTVSNTGLYTAPATTGSASVIATNGLLSGSANVTVVNAAPTIATAANASPSSVSGTATTLSVLGADDGGESNLSYTWTATTRPPGAAPTFSANGTNGAKSTTITFDRAGNYTFQAAVSDGTNTTLSTVNVTVTQTYTSVAVTPSTSSLNENGNQQFAAIALDQFAQPLTSQPSFTFSKTGGIGSVTGGGAYTAPAAAGSASISAASGGLSGVANINITNATPTVATAAAASPATTSGTTTLLSVLGADDNGEANLTYTWAATGKPVGANPLFSDNGANSAKNTTVTFDKAGTYTFTTTISDGNTSTNSSVNVTVNQSFATISVTPVLSTVALNGTTTVAATALDQFGAALLVQPPITLSNSGGGTLVGNLFTAPSSPAVSTITATAGNVVGSNTISVLNTAPTIVSPAAASSTSINGNTTALSVLGGDDNGEPNLTYTWVAVGNSPAGATFSLNGTNAAKNTVATFTHAGTYDLRATASDGSLSNTSDVYVTVNPVFTSIGVTPAAPSLNENQTQQLTATAYDQFGDPLATQPTITWTKIGVGTLSATGLYTAPASPGAAAVTATSGLISGAAAVTVTDAAPTVAVAASASPSTVIGSSTSLSVRGADDNGEPNLTYTWAATSQPVGSTVIFSSNGTHAARDATATFNEAGTYVLTSTIYDGTLATTSSVTVTVSPVLSAINVSPAAPTLNENGTQQFTATAVDQFGNALASQPAITWSQVSGGGSISAGGLYTAAGTTGSATIRASSGAVNGTATVSVTNATPTVATAAAATSTNVTGSSTGLSVLGADDGGESNLTYAWSATTKPAGANPTFSVNATNGAKNTTVTFDRAGLYVLTASISDGTASTTSSVTVNVSQTFTSIGLSPTSASVNENATQQFSAVARDQFGQSLLVQPVIAFDVPSGSGSVDALGVYTAAGAPGSATVRATSGAVTATASINTTNAAPTIVTPASAAPSTVVGTGAALSVAANDDGGESNLTYTWSATSEPAGANPVFSVNANNSAKATAVTFDKAGNYTFSVAVSDGTNTTTSSVNVAVAQTFSSIAVAPNAPQLNLNGTQQLSATALDQFGAALAVQPTITWAGLGTGATIDANGLVTATGTPGTFTATATSGLVSGSTQVTITNAAPTIATPAAASPSTVTGNTTTLTALGADDGGEPNLTYTWAATTKPAGSNPQFGVNGTHVASSDTVTFDEAGSYAFTVTISDGTRSTTSSVNVTVAQTLSSVTLSPSSAALSENATQQFVATARDQFGIALASQPPITWTKVSGVGTLGDQGLYTAPAAAGSTTIQASTGGVSATAAITVTDAAPVIVSGPSASPTAVTGTTSSLSVLGADDGGESHLTYTWAATTEPTGAVVSFSANGTNAAKNAVATFNQAGAYVFTVSVSDGVNTTAGTVTVTVMQTASSVSVTPRSALLDENGTQQFTASELDQFGNAMLVQPVLVWSVNESGATITPTGSFAASTTTGQYTVTATDGLLSGTAAVTVTNAAPTIVTAASATPSPVTGTTAALNVLANDDGGASALTYTWAATSEPGGANPTFSDNGTNSARNTSVTFDEAGNYTFTVSVSDGTNTTTSTVALTVNATPTAVNVAPVPGLNESQTAQVLATVVDQFGHPLNQQPVFTFTDTNGVGSIDSTGIFTAPPSAGTANISVGGGGLSATTSITITNAAPTIAAPATAASASINGTSTTLSVLGSDDGGQSNLTYTWSAVSEPSGAAVTFSPNGSNSSKNSTVTFNRAGTYTLRATISDGSQNITSDVTVTVNQVLSAINVAPATTNLSLNGSQQFVASALDQFGQPLAAAPPITWSISSGSGSVDSNGLFTGASTAGAATVLAQSGGVSGIATVNVANAAPTIAAAATASANPVTGTSTSLSVLGADDGGEGHLTYTWAATSAPNGATPVFSSNGINGSKNVNVSFDRAGTYAFTATISDGSQTATSSVNVVVDQTLSSIGITPPSATEQINSTQQFAATGYDQFAQAMLVQPAITYAIASGNGTVTASGLYTAPSADSNDIVTATSGAVSASAPVTVASTPSISVTVDPVAETTATATVVGAASGLTYTWTTLSKPAGAADPVFSDNGTSTAQTTTLTFDTAGTYTVQALLDNGVTSTPITSTFTVNQKLTNIGVYPSTVLVRLGALEQFTAAATDQFGKPMAAAPAFQWALANGAGSIDSSGDYQAPSAAGNATVRVSSGGVSASAAVTIQNTAPTVVTQAAATPSPVTGTSAMLSVLGDDDGGASHLIYTWSTTGNPPGPVSFSANGTNAAHDVAAVFSRAGVYTFQVGVSDGTNVVTSSVNVTVDQTLTRLAITPAPAGLNENATQQFAATGYDQFNQPLLTQAPITWSRTSGGGAIDSSGLYSSGNAAGPATVTASSGGVSASANITVQNAPPTITTAASAQPSSVTGTHTTLSVLAADDGSAGNLTYTWAATFAPPGATPIFASNGSNAASTDVTFNRAGQYTFTVTISDGSQSVSSQVSVNVQQTLSSIAVQPPTTALHYDASQQFSATALDQFGQPINSLTGFTWSVASGPGSISSSGIYQSGTTAGTAVVQAAIGSLAGVANVVVSNSGPTIAQSAMAAPGTVTATTTRLMVLGADDSGEPNLTYTWSPTSEPSGANPRFSVNGTNGAKNTTVTFDEAGSYTFAVAISDGQTSVSSAVNVTVNQTATAITLVPALASPPAGDTQQFVATARDQFARPMANQPAFNWSIASGVGSVDGNGLYTAPNSAGTATVRAIAGSLSGVAEVTVDTPPSITRPATAADPTVTGTGTSFNVGATDDGGESNLTYTWSVASAPAGANPVFSDNADNSAKGTNVTFDKAGTYQFLVTVSDGRQATTDTVSVLVQQTLSALTLTPPSASIPLEGMQSYSAAASDQFGDPMSLSNVAWSVVSGSGTIDSNGVYTASDMAGDVTVRATSNGVHGDAAVIVVDAAPTVVMPASANPSTVTGNSTQLSALGADDGGETGLTYTWSAQSAPAGAMPSFSANGTNASKQTTVTFDRAGAYGLQVSISDGTHTTVSSVTINVVQTASSLSLTPRTARIAVGDDQQFAATTLDQFGDALQNQPAYTWTVISGVGAVNQAGLYSSNSAGSAVVQVTGGGLSSSSAINVVTPSALMIVTTAYTDTPRTQSTQAALHVLAQEGIDDSGLTYRWDLANGPRRGTVNFSANDSNAAKDTVATFDRAGTYAFTVTASDASGVSVNSSVQVVVVPALTGLAVTPATQTVHHDMTAKFTASGVDQFGNDFALSSPTTWSATGVSQRIDSNGVFTAGETDGDAIITAQNAGLTGTAKATVADEPPQVSNTQASVTAQGALATLHVDALDGDDSQSSLTYTWKLVRRDDLGTASPQSRSASSSARAAHSAAAIVVSPADDATKVEFTRNGTNDAKDTTVRLHRSGRYVFQVTVSDGEKTTASDVTIISHLKKDLGDAPLVAEVAPIEANGYLTAVRVQFDEGVDAASASTLAAYRLDGEHIGHKHRSLWQRIFGGGGDEEVLYKRYSIASAQYDADLEQVVLTLAEPQRLHGQRCRLRMVDTGNTAIESDDGTQLDGNQDGRPGGTFTQTFHLSP